MKPNLTPSPSPSDAPDAHGRRTIAVIGSGIAGLSAAWLLSQRFNVTLFERDGRVGGHANTLEIGGPSGPVPVDAGFIVYNPPNYPNLTALFDHFGVATQPTRMSFAASLRGGRFEYSSRGYRGIFSQPSNLLRPRFWSLLSEIVRFYKRAEALAATDAIDDITLGAFIDRETANDRLARDHVLPMCAAIWSTTADDIRSFPLKSFIRFFANHGLFDISGRAPWRTVTGGSREYVKHLRDVLGDRIKVNAAVSHVMRDPGGVTLQTDAGAQRFSDVVIATHGDDALKLLGDASPLERSILGAFRTTPNRAILHDDAALMPRRRRAWAAWNYLEGDSDTGERPLSVTYWMNELQRLPAATPAFVTLNPLREPKKGSIKHVIDYTHPVFDQAALDAQTRLWEIQGCRNTWFCGSYFGYGFHEDALQSGLAVAEAFGVKRPWQVENASGRMPPMPRLMEAAE
ncbi:hypothetical protein sos41_07410 [Alphaproteobacteria bacterium SO-S41]|nr:hypothetical protein sos41_07410 [Alphaproteobacteria bacterium SO-S41]